MRKVHFRILLVSICSDRKYLVNFSEGFQYCHAIRCKEVDHLLFLQNFRLN